MSEYYEKYYLKNKKIIEKFCNQNYKVRLFSFYNREGDLVAINKIKSMANEKFLDNIEVVSYNGEIAKFLYKFQQMEKIIACRFHFIILGQVFVQEIYIL